MPINPKALAIPVFQTLLCAGALVLAGSYPDPAQFKIPLMLLGCLGLLPLLASRLRAETHLLPGLLLFIYLYARLLPSPGQHTAALSLLACASAFLFGVARVPMADVRLLIPFALLCAGRSVMDLVTLDHLGGEAPPGHAVTSFFLDKHVTGGVLVLGAFLHFHLMEKSGGQKPLPVLLYTSGLAVLMALVLCDSRVAQGALLACVLPLLFLTIRLDGKEPALERLAWVAGITLCLGIAWINLPEWQLQRVADSIAPASGGGRRIAWSAALEMARESPLAGSGLGTFRWASVPYLGGWIEYGNGGQAPVLDHAGSHFLQVLAEGGAIACSLEAFLLLIALLGMSVLYYKEWTLQARYGFLSLAALSLIGLFTSALDAAPLNVAYWALIGYGWSFAMRAMPDWIAPSLGEAAGARRRDRVAGALAASALACLICWHLFHRAGEFRAQRLLAEAQALATRDPKLSTDKLIRALALDPRNEEANYSYARVLAFFHRGVEAEKRVAFAQELAPDWRREAQVLAEVYLAMDDQEGVAAQAARLLAAYPHHLEALEMRAGALRAAGLCRDLEDFLDRQAAGLPGIYAMPRSRDYTIQSLDSVFMANRDINFLQRWFAGPALRQRFVEKRLLEYSRGFQYHSRARFLRDARCKAPEEDGPDGDDGSYPLEKPARLSPEGEPEPREWTTPAPGGTDKATGKASGKAEGRTPGGSPGVLQDKKPAKGPTQAPKPRRRLRHLNLAARPPPAAEAAAACPA